MKTVNAYYRKHGTMKGFGDLTDEKAAEIDEKVKNGYSWVTVPYAAFQLSNNNAEINRLKKRIAVLEQRDETGFVGWKFEGGEAVANQEENRLQLIFDGKPTEEQRSQLKGGASDGRRQTGHGNASLTTMQFTQRGKSAL